MSRVSFVSSCHAFLFAGAAPAIIARSHWVLWLSPFCLKSHIDFVSSFEGDINLKLVSDLTNEIFQPGNLLSHLLSVP